jgi:D-aminoacyl-tRNA deacylase
VRAVVQRVSSARVLVGERTSGAIDRGLLVFVGVEQSDSDADATWLAAKIATMRIFRDAGDRMNLAVDEAGGAILLVSQFTLLGDARRGRRPSFARAASADVAQRLFERVGVELEARGLGVAYGVFGADMDVQASNQGPVTILLDSNQTF